MRVEVKVRVEIRARCAVRVLALVVIEDRLALARLVPRTPPQRVTIRVQDLRVAEFPPLNPERLRVRKVKLVAGIGPRPIEHDDPLHVEPGVLRVALERMFEFHRQVDRGIAVVVQVRDFETVLAVVLDEFERVQMEPRLPSRDGPDTLMRCVEIKFPFTPQAVGTVVRGLSVGVRVGNRDVDGGVIRVGAYRISGARGKDRENHADQR